MAIGSAWLFSRAWTDIAQSYALLSIQEKVATLRSDSANLDDGEWALTMRLENDASSRDAKWIRPPGETPNEATLLKIEEALFDGISQTNLRAGSFSLSLPSNGSETPYFIVFRSNETLGEESRIAIVGTRVSIGLHDIAPLLVPLFGIVALSVAAMTLLIFTISRQLDQSITRIERTVEDIGAGRFTRLKFPDSKEPALRSLNRALKSMVTSLAQHEEQVAKITAAEFEDPTTRIPNFRSLNTYVDRILEEKDSEAASRTMLMLIDIDNFKHINEAHGHQVGDFVLREAARIIKANIRYPNKRAPDRKPDLCSRYGGEEFFAVFNDVTLKGRQSPALRILHALKGAELHVPKEISRSGKSFVVKISVSMGLSIWDSKRLVDKESWMKETEQALEIAKTAGGGRIVAVHPEKAQWP